MITGIILAAGESKRMGRPKALLTVQGQTFIRRIIDLLRHPSIDPIVVVLGAHAEAVRNKIKDLDVTVVVNPDYPLGQLSSLIVGINEAERVGSKAIIVHPVDHPLVKSETVKLLLEEYLKRGAPIVLPTFKDKRGHPVLFSSSLFHELTRAPTEVGARAVVWAHEKEVAEVPCDDAGVVANVNTEGDYTDL